MIWNSKGCINIGTTVVQQFQLVNNLPEDGLVKPKHVAIKCDFNDILK
jgi:hypothetical protein